MADGFDVVAIRIDRKGTIVVRMFVAPRLVGGLIESIRTVTSSKLIVVYPNSGAQYDARRKCWYEGEAPAEWARHALSWYRAGADMIGGCCRIGPQHIHQLATRTAWHY